MKRMIEKSIDARALEVMFNGVEVRTPDRNYATVVKPWLEGIYIPWYREFMVEHGVTEWKPDWDCDDFAAMFRIGAQMMYANGKGLSKPEGISIGEMHYMSTKGGHAINVALIQIEEGFLDAIYIEPQTAALKGVLHILELTEEEIKNRWYIRF